jgi:uncharacterized membrane protein (UPF0127 family)
MTGYNTGSIIKNCDTASTKTCNSYPKTLKIFPKIYGLVGHVSLIYAMSLGYLAVAIAQPVAPDPSRAQVLPITATAQIARKTVRLEVTRDLNEQARGLMFRDTLPDDRGMLFSFNPPYPTQFWMKNCAVPLDIVFIYQNQVAAIALNTPPCTKDPCPIYPGKPVIADQVIELRANWTKEMGLKVGDRVTVEFLKAPKAK